MCCEYDPSSQFDLRNFDDFPKLHTPFFSGPLTKRYESVKNLSNTPSSIRNLKETFFNPLVSLTKIDELTNIGDTRSKGYSTTVEVIGGHLLCSIRCNDHGATQLTLRYTPKHTWPPDFPSQTPYPQQQVR